MTFFFDNTFSARLVSILKLMRVDACHLRDTFPQGTDDTVWLPVAGAQGWIVVTGDHRIRRNPAERHALQKANVVAYFVFRNFAQHTAWEQAKWIINHWQAIEAHALAAQPGHSYEINSQGVIRELP